jgi:hypothetical protein
LEGEEFAEEIAVGGTVRLQGARWLVSDGNRTSGDSKGAKFLHSSVLDWITSAYAVIAGYEILCLAPKHNSVVKGPESFSN